MAAVMATAMPIAELTPYLGKWAIKAKVTSKAPVRNFKKGGAGSEGKVFSVDLADAEGGDIRASFFNEAATKFVDVLQTGKIYTFSRGTLRAANKQFNNTNSRYEISFNADAQITEVIGEVDSIKTTFTFVDLRTVQSKTLPCRIDLCGIVTQARPVQTITARDGRELVKRDISVADDTAVSMEVTLWGDKGKLSDAEFEGFPVVALKTINIKEWSGGRSGSSSESTQVLLRPDLPEALRLRKWWIEGGGSAQNLVSLRGVGGPGSVEPCTVTQLRAFIEQVTEKQRSFSMTARLTFVQMRRLGEQQALHYTACAEMRDNQWGSFLCGRRVDENGFCAVCNRAGKTSLRLNVRCKYADFGADCWLTTFHEAAENVLGMNAGTIAEIDGVNCAGREQLETALRKRLYFEPLQLRLKAKLDTWQGEQKNKCVLCRSRTSEPTRTW